MGRRAVVVEMIQREEGEREGGKEEGERGRELVRNEGRESLRDFDQEMAKFHVTQKSYQGSQSCAIFRKDFVSL